MHNNTMDNEAIQSFVKKRNEDIQSMNCALSNPLFTGGK
jgi:hypothetical protein